MMVRLLMRRMDPAFNGLYTKGAISGDVEREERCCDFETIHGKGMERKELVGRHSAPNLTIFLLPKAIRQKVGGLWAKQSFGCRWCCTCCLGLGLERRGWWAEYVSGDLTADLGKLGRLSRAALDRCGERLP
jgi:hypothetical protein